jgi:hypothetical protein
MSCNKHKVRYANSCFRDAPHDSGNRADGKGGDDREHMTVELLGKGWYHVYTDAKGGDKLLS